MSEEDNIKQQLVEKFRVLSDKITVQRTRRMFADVPLANFSEIFDYAVNQLKFSILVTITGLDEGASLGFIYHLARENGIVLNLHTSAPKDKPVIKTITPYFPAADAYERELIDLFGAQVTGLPEGSRYPLPDDWPPNQFPLRKDWKAEYALKERRQTKMPHRNFKVSIGPQHPALKEPESFTLILKGEKIAAMNVRLGYNHRGIEKACEERTYIQDLYLIERICGICSHSHSTCFVQAVEEIAGLAVPKRALYIRTLIAELERIHSHLLWLGVAGHEVGFDTLLMYTWRDREVVMDMLAILTGNRVNYGMNTIGGVRRDITAEQKQRVLKAIDTLEERTKYYIQVATQETTLIKRLSGVGLLSHDDAIRLGAVGPTARASGVDRDIRRDDPYAAYSELSFNVITDNHNDVYGRTLVRVGELMESYKMIRQILANLPEGPIAVKAPRKIPAGQAFSRYEAPRGEDAHYVRANGTEKPERVKVRAPTLANVQVVSHMLKNRYLADMPIVIAAIDPCFSCTDRTIAVNRDNEKSPEVMNWSTLRSYSIDWYRRQGVDFSRLNKKFRIPREI